jgi:hypothetical protein
LNIGIYNAESKNKPIENQYFIGLQILIIIADGLQIRPNCEQKRILAFLICRKRFAMSRLFANLAAEMNNNKAKQPEETP